MKKTNWVLFLHLPVVLVSLDATLSTTPKATKLHSPHYYRQNSTYDTQGYAKSVKAFQETLQTQPRNNPQTYTETLQKQFNALVIYHNSLPKNQQNQDPFSILQQEITTINTALEKTILQLKKEKTDTQTPIPLINKLNNINEQVEQLIFIGTNLDKLATTLLTKQKKENSQTPLQKSESFRIFAQKTPKAKSTINKKLNALLSPLQKLKLKIKETIKRLKKKISFHEKQKSDHQKVPTTKAILDHLDYLKELPLLLDEIDKYPSISGDTTKTPKTPKRNHHFFGNIGEQFQKKQEDIKDAYQNLLETCYSSLQLIFSDINLLFANLSLKTKKTLPNIETLSFSLNDPNCSPSTLPKFTTPPLHHLQKTSQTLENYLEHLATLKQFTTILKDQKTEPYIETLQQAIITLKKTITFHKNKIEKFNNTKIEEITKHWDTWQDIANGQTTNLNPSNLPKPLIEKIILLQKLHKQTKILPQKTEKILASIYKTAKIIAQELMKKLPLQKKTLNKKIAKNTSSTPLYQQAATIETNLQTCKTLQQTTALLLQDNILLTFSQESRLQKIQTSLIKHKKNLEKQKKIVDKNKKKLLKHYMQTRTYYHKNATLNNLTRWREIKNLCLQQLAKKETPNDIIPLRKILDTKIISPTNPTKNNHVWILSLFICTLATLILAIHIIPAKKPKKTPPNPTKKHTYPQKHLLLALWLKILFPWKKWTFIIDS